MLPPPISAKQALERVIWADKQTEHCHALWRAVIWRIVLDLEPGWGISIEDAQEARAWFESKSKRAIRNREELCDLAGIGTGQLLEAYRAGRLRDLALDPVGRRRWETRMRNKAAKQAALAAVGGTAVNAQGPIKADTLTRRRTAQKILEARIKPNASAPLAR